MERVAFLIDDTGERIDCLLNPESFDVRRLAGVRVRGTAGGQVIAAAMADDPLLFTGGGRTELVLDLLFDTDLVEAARRPADVRELTHRLWTLTENSAGRSGVVGPPLVRLVWGKSWNVPGVVVAVSERFDAISLTGSPRRSWLRLKMVRLADAATPGPVTYEEALVPDAGAAPAAAAVEAVQAVGDGQERPGAIRIDLLASEALGDPMRWRLLADHNDLADPFDIPPATVLAVPTSGARLAPPPPPGAPAPPVSPRWAETP
jgi:hypothetical protein